METITIDNSASSESSSSSVSIINKEESENNTINNNNNENNENNENNDDSSSSTTTNANNNNDSNVASNGTVHHFQIPYIFENEDGWGPVGLPDPKFQEIPYAPFSKGDKLGRAADWYATGKGFQRGYKTEYGLTGNMFAFRSEEDDDSFQIVETRETKKPFRKAWQQRTPYPQRGRGVIRGASSSARGGLGRGSSQPGRGGRQATQGGRGFNRGQFVPKTRVRDSSVDVRPDWEILEQIDFSTLAKLGNEKGDKTPIPEAVDLVGCGAVEYYNLTYDKLSTKGERPLEVTKRTFFKVTTTDDPVIRRLASTEGDVFATDSILATLMTCTRSSYSWDIVAHRVGSKLFLDKRDNSPIDFLTVNETASEPPVDDKNDPINSPHALSQEATFINQNYSQQVLGRGRDAKKHDFGEANPFASPGEEVASAGYRYRKWEFGGITLVARTEVDAVLQENDKESFIAIHALNEYDPKLQGIDYRKKIDSRGAVLATEVKNNGNKIARWTAQALLSGAESINVGFIVRNNPKDSFNHQILRTQFYNTKLFLPQIGLNVKNMWAILKHFINLCMQQPQGKYVLLKDPNKPLVRLYAVPKDTFEGDEAENEEDLSGTQSDDKWSEASI